MCLHCILAGIYFKMFHLKKIILCCLLFGLAEAYLQNDGFRNNPRVRSEKSDQPTYLEYADQCETRKFPVDFKFGAASSAYQIEGGWNADGKIPSVWDEFVRLNREKNHNLTGDISCDSYHLWERDIEMCVELGLQVYRFSISPARLYPYGKINPAGLKYYNNLINGLLAKGIEPLVTMFHWDLPNYLQEMGGLSNPTIISFFESYARILYQNFGDRVKKWITFNEALIFCNYGYGTSVIAPGLNNTIAEFACSKNLLLSHAKMYHVYDKEFRPSQKGEVAMTFATAWFEPATNSEEDEIAAYKALTLFFLQFAHPIYVGDWPQVMKDAVEQHSVKSGYPKSVLQAFTQPEIDYIKGTADFLGLNLYTAFLVSHGPAEEDSANLLSFNKVADINYSVDPSWRQGESVLVHDVPFSMYKMLKFIKEAFNNPRVFITENGWSTAGTIYDYSRVDYMRGYLNAVRDAMLEGSNVIGYCHWSLMDSFEWISAYTEKMGLYSVDFNDPKRTRVPNLSAFVYKDIIQTRCVNPLYNPEPAQTDISNI